MSHYRMLDHEPSAIITVAGSEKKIYQGGQIFINDGENFEIRFFNPLQEKIGVEIIFNGIKKNDGLLVLRPGEDITLDRFLGEKKKMKYETYTIDGDSKSAVKAAELNGLVEFKFYKEKINYGCGFITFTNNNFNFNSPTYTSPGVYGTSTTASGYYNTNGINLTGSIGASTDSFFYDAQPLKRTKSLKSKKVETGRIEKGPESNQDLKTVDVEFDLTPFHTINYLLKPNSQKPTEITEVRQYCTKCAYRIRKQSWKFCPKCSFEI